MLLGIVSLVTSIIALVCFAWMVFTIMVHCFQVGSIETWNRLFVVWKKWYNKIMPVFFVLVLIELYLRW